MSSLLNEFVSKTDFESYSDFEKNFSINIPEEFNFSYDVVDKYAEMDPKKLQLYGATTMMRKGYSPLKI